MHPKWLSSAVVVLALLVPGVSNAEQAVGSEPQVLELTWTTWPLTAGAEEILEITAQDPDGVITTANVFWGNGVFTHADLICFDQGEVVSVLLSIQYERAGLYPVRVWVESGPRCFTTEQRSPRERTRARVHPGE